MPEIKHSFISGKMNKDLDERIVPNGEYRNALNVQVSTSEGGDVGTVQNVLGNSIIAGQSNISDAAVCIATIADEKNDKIYWFVSDGGNELIENLPNLEDDSNWFSFSSSVVATHSPNNLTINTANEGLPTPPAHADTQYPYYRTRIINDLIDGKNYSVKIVFGNNDIGGAQSTNYMGGIVPAVNKVFVAGITDIYGTTGNSNYRPKGENTIFNISNPGGSGMGYMSPTGNTVIETDLEYSNSFTFNQASNLGSTAIRLQFEFINGKSYDKSLEILSLSFIEEPTSYILEYDVKTDTVNLVVVDVGNNFLQFDPFNVITGVNIIDGLLFWTDGVNEPKKINIERCKAGTSDTLTNTQLLVKEEVIRDLELRDITVIKKGPKTPLTVQKIKSRDSNGVYSGIVTISDNNDTYNSILNSSQGPLVHDFQVLSVGDTFKTIIETDINFSNDFSLSWSDGDTVLLQAFDSPGEYPQPPLDLSNSWNIKGYITDWVHNNFTNYNLNLIDPHVHTTLGGWTVVSSGSIETGPWENTNEVNNQKLQIFSDHPSYPGLQHIKQGRHYRYSFNIDVSDTNGVLKGKLLHGLKDENNNQEVFYIHDLTSSDAGYYEFEVDDTAFVDGSGTASLFTSNQWGSPDCVWFECKPDSNGNKFEGKISNVTLERIDQSPARVEIKITNINGVPPIPQGAETQLDYVIDVSTTADILFEKKLPRFSYRYKYEDGEYSTFAPFTDVVFSPGNFGYKSTDGFNVGMSNTTKSITLGSINQSKPDDVVSVDILYKEEGSPSVYVVDTLKGDQDSYNIKKETINGILAENQILRLWDNVPTSAKSQEVVGNRIIYGNYTQNYDLVHEADDMLIDYDLDLSVNINSKSFGADNYGRSSVKSLREYQLGVVYTDVYGRETPVLTNSSSTIRLDKSFSEEQNSFLVQVKTNGHPINMNYFKFYIKDTSGEYYNMAMDRYFDAEDGNVWLSFPSVDRNKIDIDDNIILKKGIESSSVLNKAKYKVIDISNEAPEYIKKQDSLVMKKIHTDSVVLFETPPQYLGDQLTLNPARFSNSVHQNFATHFNSRPTGVDYYIVFSHNSFDNVSRRYKITSFESDQSAYLGVDGKFDFDVLQFSDAPDGTIPVTNMLDQTFLSIIKEEVINSPKFDGRFFVKIKKDADFNNIDPNLTLSDEYVTTQETSKKIYLAKGAINDDTNHPVKHGGLGKFWEGYANYDQPADFDLGRSATKTILGPNDSQIGTLKHYWQRRINSLTSHGDYDYASDNTSENSPGFSNKLATQGSMFGWKAYFRGINTETLPVHSMNPSIGRNQSIDIEVDKDNNKFEDVWFISECKHTASIPLDKGLEVSNSYPSHSRQTQTVWTPRNQGWQNWTSTNSSALTISFGGISPNQWEDNSTPNRPDNDYSFFDIGNDNLNYAAANSKFVEQLSAGSRFMFKEDPTKTVYTITDAQLYHKVMYDNIEEAYDHSPPNNENHYKGQVQSLKGDHDICDDDGNLPVKYRCSSFLDASNFVVIYKLFLDKQAVWNPAFNIAQGKITNGLDLKLSGSDANPVVTKSSGDANLVVDSISAVDENTGQLHRLEVGLVLYKHSTHTISKEAIITNITNNIGDGTFTLQFRCYEGDERDLDGSGNGTFPGIGTSDDLFFAQFHMNGLSKNSAKNINYFNDAGVTNARTGVDALGYTMQFLTIATSEKEDDVLSSTDPAVFETEPKKDKELDIYYEASRAIPIIEDPSSFASLLPVGSVVEHEGSDCIPLNTTITSVSLDGTIILSNKANVEHVPPTYRTEQFTTQ